MLTLSGWGFSDARDVSDVSSRYLKMKDAMVAGNAKDAASNARELVKALHESPEFSGRDKAISAVMKISKSTDIEKQRKELAVVSPIIWKYLMDHTNADQTLYYQYCPMQKAHWISSEPAIRNPYYGNKMMSCGNVSDSLK